MVSDKFLEHFCYIITADERLEKLRQVERPASRRWRADENAQQSMRMAIAFVNGNGRRCPSTCTLTQPIDN